MANQPPQPFPAVRYVSTNEGSGLLLRQAKPGVAFGHFRWVNAAELGRIWVPQHRVVTNGSLALLTESIAAQELKRYVRRRRERITGAYHERSEPIINPGLDGIINSEQDHLDPRLWPRLLSGCDPKAPLISPDAIDSQTVHLDRALAAFAAVEQVSGGASLCGECRLGQLQLPDRQALVWKSPVYDWMKMVQILKKLALDHPSEPELLVVGDGHIGQSTAAWVEPDRSVDFTVKPEKGHFTSVRYRRIFWRPLGEIENSLTDPNTSTDQKRAAIKHQLSPS